MITIQCKYCTFDLLFVYSEIVFLFHVIAIKLCDLSRGPAAVSGSRPSPPLSTGGGGGPSLSHWQAGGEDLHR
jgi:hypothetical protein